MFFLFFLTPQVGDSRKAVNQLMKLGVEQIYSYDVENETFN